MPGLFIHKDMLLPTFPNAVANTQYNELVQIDMLTGPYIDADTPEIRERFQRELKLANGRVPPADQRKFMRVALSDNLLDELSAGDLSRILDLQDDSGGLTVELLDLPFYLVFTQQQWDFNVPPYVPNYLRADGTTNKKWNEWADATHPVTIIEDPPGTPIYYISSNAGVTANYYLAGSVVQDLVQEGRCDAISREEFQSRLPEEV